MNLFPVEDASDIESELVDLGTMPLTELRTLDDATLNRAMRQVVDRTRSLRVTRISGQDNGGGRID